MNKQIIFLSSLLAIGTGLTFECHGASSIGRTLSAFRSMSMRRFAKLAAGGAVAATSATVMPQRMHQNEPIQTFKVMLAKHKGMLYGGLNELHVLENEDEPFGFYEGNNETGIYSHLGDGPYTHPKDSFEKLSTTARVLFHYASPRRSGENSWTKPRLNIDINNLHKGTIAELTIVPEVSFDGQQFQMRATFEQTYAAGASVLTKLQPTTFEAVYPTYEGCKNVLEIMNEAPSADAMDKCMRTPLRLVLPQFTHATTDEEDPWNPLPRTDWKEYHRRKEGFARLPLRLKEERIEKLKAERRKNRMAESSSRPGTEVRS